MAKTVATYSAGPFTAQFGSMVDPLASQWRAVTRRIRMLTVRTAGGSKALVRDSAVRHSMPERPSQLELHELLKAGL